MSRTTRLRSGRVVEIRPIQPSDGPALRVAFDRLSDLSRYRRFLSPKPRLSTGDVRFLTEVDGCRHVALVATPVGRPDDILAVARFVALTDQPRTAEFAITVGDPFQGEGLGSVLADQLADEALRHGIDRLTATVLAENLPAQRLLRRLRGRLSGERHLGPVDELEIELAVAA